MSSVFVAMPIGKPFLDETVLQLLHKQMDISFELLWILDASGGQIVINPLLGELFNGQLGHPTLGNGDLLRRVILINFLKTIGAEFLQVDLVFVLLIEDEVENLLSFVVTAHEGGPQQGFDVGDVRGIRGEGGRL